MVLCLALVRSLGIDFGWSRFRELDKTLSGRGDLPNRLGTPPHRYKGESPLFLFTLGVRSLGSPSRRTSRLNSTRLDSSSYTFFDRLGRCSKHTPQSAKQKENYITYKHIHIYSIRTAICQPSCLRSTFTPYPPPPSPLILSCPLLTAWRLLCQCKMRPLVASPSIVVSCVIVARSSHTRPPRMDRLIRRSIVRVVTGRRTRIRTRTRMG